MITASKARKQTLQNNVTKYEKIFENLEMRINAAIENGKYSISCENSLPEFVNNKLIELGYITNYRQCGINEYETVISWETAEIVEEDDKDPYPCASCDPSIREVCCGCDKERKWSERHPGIFN